MKSLIEDLKKRPIEPSAIKERRHTPVPWLEGFVHDGRQEHKKVESSVSDDSSNNTVYD